MPRRALVTGGAGFIGSHVADLLIASDYAVTVIDNLSSGKRSQVPSAAAFEELDICAPDAAAAVREGKFDVVCHLAAQIDVRKSVADPAADATLNIGGSLNLLEAVRQSGHATRFVFSSHRRRGLRRFRRRRQRPKTRPRIRSRPTASRSSRRALHGVLRARARTRLRGASLLERLRSAPGSARRGRRRRDLLRPPPRWRAAHGLRRRRADARLRLRRRRRAGQPRGGDHQAPTRRRCRQPRLQHRHGHRDSTSSPSPTSSRMRRAERRRSCTRPRARASSAAPPCATTRRKVLGWKPQMSLRRWSSRHLPMVRGSPRGRPAHDARHR